MADRPTVTFRGATLHRSHGSPRIGDLALVDGRVASAPAPGAEVVDARGLAVVPLAREFVDRGVETLPVDAAASIAVVRHRRDDWRPRGTVIVRPDDLHMLMLDGRLVAVDGVPVARSGTTPGDWVGAWRDERTGMIQHLRPDGRYSETRGGIPDSWTGRYWTGGDLIAYLDDTGFWAFGRRDGDLLRHADFLLRRMPSVS